MNGERVEPNGARGLTARPITADEADASARLGHEAFGSAPPPVSPDATSGPDPWPPPGMHPIGLFDGDRLVGRVHGREFGAYFGGRELPLWGIGGVTVSPEYRGRGGLSPMFAASLAAARAQGAAVSTLSAAAMAPYRRFGYELVGARTVAAIRPSELAAVKPGTGVNLVRAELSDAAELHRVYTRWASEQNGPLTRTGPQFPAYPQSLIRESTGVTVAVDHTGAAIGYAAWQRGQGDASAAVRVTELIALSDDAARALLRFLGGFGSNVDEILVHSSGTDPITFALPGKAWTIRAQSRYMLRVLDPVAAIERRRYSDLLAGDVSFVLRDDPEPGCRTGYRLEVADGRASCTPCAPDAIDGPTFTANGFAVTYAGTQSVENLRSAGLVIGGTQRHGERLDAVFGGRQFHIRDQF